MVRAETSRRTPPRSGPPMTRRGHPSSEKRRMAHPQPGLSPQRVGGPFFLLYQSWSTHALFTDLRRWCSVECLAEPSSSGAGGRHRFET